MSMPVHKDLTSPELVELFNHAATLARQGDYEASLEAWDLLVGPGRGRDRPAGRRVMTGEFLGVATMRRAWVLMDLGRREEALLALKDPVMEACLSQLRTEDLYEYHFSLGNTLGTLGRIRKMDRQFTMALNIAAEELGDLERCCRTWSNLMRHAERAQAWRYLERESLRAVAFATKTGARALGFEARFRHAVALRGLGRDDEARQEAEALLVETRAAGVTAVVARLEEIVASCG